MAKDIQNAAGYGNLKEIQRFLNKGVSIDNAGHYGLTPLMNAVLCWQNEAAQYLIENGANVNAIDDFQRTALMHAAHSGNVAGLDLLLAHGADLELLDEEGFSALMHAEQSSKEEAILFLKNFVEQHL